MLFTFSDDNMKLLLIKGGD